MTDTDYTGLPKDTEVDDSVIVICSHCGKNGLKDTEYPNAVVHVRGLRAWLDCRIDWCWPTNIANPDASPLEL